MKVLTTLGRGKAHKAPMKIQDVVPYLFNDKHIERLALLQQAHNDAHIQKFAKMMARHATQRLRQMKVAVPGQVVIVASGALMARTVTKEDVMFDQVKSLFSTNFLKSEMGPNFEIEKPRISENLFSAASVTQGNAVGRYDGVEVVMIDSKLTFCIKLIQANNDSHSADVVRSEVFADIAAINEFRLVDEASSDGSDAPLKNALA